MGDFLELNLKHFCIWGQNYFFINLRNNKKNILIVSLEIANVKVVRI